MSAFERNNTPINFEEIDDSPLEIVLKFKDDFEGTWENNESNQLPFKQVKQLLTKPRICYFQKQKSDERNKRSRHKIYVPIDNEKAIALSVVLRQDEIDEFTKLNSYFASKSKEVVFIQPPQKDVYQAECYFRISSLNRKEGSNSQRFIELYKHVDSLNIPTVDINKEKDKQIWDNYVRALKRLVKQKEIVWKIKEISNVYNNKKIDSETVNYIDITINEENVNEMFKKNLATFFSSKDVQDVEATKERAFVKFNTYRILSENELVHLKDAASEYFYDLVKEPRYEITGNLNFKYSQETIINEICQKLYDEYKFKNILFDENKLDITDKDFPHVKKCIENNFQNIASIIKDNSIKLKVTINVEVDIDINLIKFNLKQHKISKSKAYQSNGQIIIEADAEINSKFLKAYGLTLQKTIVRFGNNKNQNSLVEVDGLYIIDGEYQTSDKINVSEKLKEIQDANHDTSIAILPKRYFFGTEEQKKQNISLLREIKTKTDLKDKTSFDIDNSILTITANSIDDYRNQIKRIKEYVPKNVNIETKDFKQLYYIHVNPELQSQYEYIIENLRNTLKNNSLDVKLTPLTKTTQKFEYSFSTEEERESLKKTIKKVVDSNNRYVEILFDNELGYTTYVFKKNTSLELDKEKETKKNISRASFIYLSEGQNKLLQQKIAEDGDDAVFKEGIPIGVLSRKEKNKLIFKISPEFDDFISKSFDNIQEVKNGFLKPIFPGELTNIRRMIIAMSKVTTPGENKKGLGYISYPANKNLPNFLFDPTFVRESSQDLEEVKERILSNLNEPLLKKQPKQLEAVAKALIATDMALIQGPPGTGKTTVIAEIIWQTLLQNPEARILVTSQTNLAVDNALERLRGKKFVRPIRIGRIERFEDEGKLYSNKILQLWSDAKTNSEDELYFKDNAINEWIKSICSQCSEDTEYASIVDKWKKGLLSHPPEVKKLFFSEYLKHVNVFAATCSECGSRNFADAYQEIFNQNKAVRSDLVFDVVIMDEASKATPPELVLPLTLGRKVIIIGDHKQLPPMLDEKDFTEALEAIGAKELVENWTEQDYKTSQFEKLFTNAPKSIVASLDTQFRMHKQIMNCISQFYKDQEELKKGLVCGIESTMDIPDLTNKASRWHGLELQPFISPDTHAIWVNVDGIEKKVGTSYENLEEINAIKLVLNALKKANTFEKYYNSFFKDIDKEIGIITYYMPQMNRIREVLYPTFNKENKWKNFEQHKYENEYQIPFRINTVDRFQGMERNIIIISTVRSSIQIDEKGNEQKNNRYPFALGFAKEPQRVNVGFSRAKRLLIVVGNEKHFAHKAEYAEAIKNMKKIDVKQLQNL